MTDETPRWEHGYRCHGYWLGVVQWGRVSIDAHRFGAISKKGAYEWAFTPEGSAATCLADGLLGKVDRLGQGKRIVERMYREWVKAKAVTS